MVHRIEKKRSFNVCENRGVIAQVRQKVDEKTLLGEGGKE